LYAAGRESCRALYPLMSPPYTHRGCRPLSTPRVAPRCSPPRHLHRVAVCRDTSCSSAPAPIAALTASALSILSVVYAVLGSVPTVLQRHAMVSRSSAVPHTG